ncbi:MAG: hypothetical protein GY794_05465, partial [bacterium]|nr:hypothetical protein [bacterium]
MKINTIFSITAIFVIILVGFVTHNARAFEVTTNLRPWLEEEEFSLDTSLHATLDQVIIFELEPPDTRDRHKKRHKKDRDRYHHKHAKDFEKYKNYQRNQEERDKDYGKFEEEYEKDNDEYRKGSDEDHDKYHSKKSKSNGRHKKQKLYLGHHELKWNSVRFVIPEPTEGSFCLFGDEPYITALELETADGERVLWSRPGDDCTILELEADRYLLHVLHDPQNIDGQSRKVFFHRPGQARLLGNVDSNFIAPNFMAFKGPKGQFVSDDTSDSPLLSVQAIATSVGAHEVWSLGGSSPYTLTDGNGARLKNNLSITAQFVGKSPDTGDFIATYKITDLGNSQFTLSLASFVDAPINTRNAEQQLFRSSKNHATFTADYKGFDCKTCDSSTLPLQEGEAALFAGCNYTGPAIVFGTDVPDLSIYDGAAALGLGIGDNMAASIRLGPNTFGLLYQDSQFSGTSIGVAMDTPCLDVTDLGTAAASSLQVTTDIRQYIIVSDTCENCDLTGLDLSDLDFTAGLFTGTNFSDANLTNTIFRSARLDHATFFGNTTILAGTDLADAILFCTDLSGNDLSTVSFDDDPIITKDFSCRLDLSGTTLPINALPFASWRYINFTGATLLNGAGTTISTLADPVDLSGAMLSSVTGLSGVILDGADLGCATPTETEKNCTELIDIDLSNASLTQANLAEAAMNGANLIQANLEMADLSGAQLLKSPTKFDSAKLDGAFLKNANLAEA